MISCLKGYASYKFKNIDKLKKRSTIQSLKEFSTSQLEKELESSRVGNEQYTTERDKAISKLDEKISLAVKLSFIVEFIMIIIAALFVHFCLKLNSIYISVIAIVLFRLVLFLFKNQFNVNRFIRNYIFILLAKMNTFYKLYPKDVHYEAAMNKLKEKSI